VENHDRNPVGAAAFLPVELMAVSDRQPAGESGLGRRVKRTARKRRIH
jgi:hypothetical protein